MTECYPYLSLILFRQVDGETRVGVFALRPIKVNEPLTYDYRYLYPLLLQIVSVNSVAEVVLYVCTILYKCFNTSNLFFSLLSMLL